LQNFVEHQKLKFYLLHLKLLVLQDLVKTTILQFPYLVEVQGQFVLLF
jgi:hypothetical protein